MGFTTHFAVTHGHVQKMLEKLFPEKKKRCGLMDDILVTRDTESIMRLKLQALGE